MSSFTRGSYFAKLAIADLLFYRIPRVLWALLWRWPRAVLRLLARLVGLRRGQEGAPRGERDVEVVYCNTNPRIANAFGLARSPTVVTAATVKTVSDATAPPLAGQSSLPDGAAPPRPSLSYAGPLYNGHLHTLFSGLRPAWHRFEYHRQRVMSGDGQHLNLDLLLPCMLDRGHGGGGGGGEGREAVSPSDRTTDPPTLAERVHMQERVRGMIFVIPGLLNASTTNYVRNFAYQAASSGFAVAVLNYRGMGSTPLEVPRLFSATFTDDIRYILEHYFSPAQVREMVYGPTPSHLENIPVIGVGFSLGGVTLVKYVSEEGRRIARGEKTYLDGGKATAAEEMVRPPGLGACRLDAVIAVTSPYDLVASDRATRRRAYRLLYEKPFAVGFRKFVKHNQKIIEALPNVDGRALFHGAPTGEATGAAARKAGDGAVNGKGPAERQRRTKPLIHTITSIREFDTLINATHNGFSCPEEYYAAANSIPWLKHCRTPCVCMANSGDPVCGPAIPSEVWREEVVRENPNVLYVCFPVGGHLGFVGSPTQEVSGRANVMERFVLDCAQCFTETASAAAGEPAVEKLLNGVIVA